MLFVQIVRPKSGDAQNPPMKEKWKAIEDAINDRVLVENEKITKYRIFWGADIGFMSPNNHDLYQEIRHHLS